MLVGRRLISRALAGHQSRRLARAAAGHRARLSYPSDALPQPPVPAAGPRLRPPPRPHRPRLRPLPCPYRPRSGRRPTPITPAPLRLPPIPRKLGAIDGDPCFSWLRPAPPHSGATPRGGAPAPPCFLIPTPTPLPPPDCPDGDTTPSQSNLAASGRSEPSGLVVHSSQGLTTSSSLAPRSGAPAERRNHEQREGGAHRMAVALCLLLYRVSCFLLKQQGKKLVVCFGRDLSNHWIAQVQQRFQVYACKPGRMTNHVWCHYPREQIEEGHQRVREKVT